MNTVRELTVASIAALEQNDRAEALSKVTWLLCEVLGVSRAQLLSAPDFKLDEFSMVRFAGMMERCVAGEPVQYVVGYTEFMGLRIDVCAGVLIPRPETEQLVELGLGLIKDVSTPRIADLGSGSGCIALAAKHFRPDAFVAGVENSLVALDVAIVNGRRNGLKVSWNRMDMTTYSLLELGEGSYDLVFSNPPYIPESERAELDATVLHFEPAEALFAENEGLAVYERMIPTAMRLLSDSGWLAVEVHYKSAERVTSIFEACGFQNVAVNMDYAGLPRMVTGLRGS